MITNETIDHIKQYKKVDNQNNLIHITFDMFTVWEPGIFINRRNSMLTINIKMIIVLIFENLIGLPSIESSLLSNVLGVTILKPIATDLYSKKSSFKFRLSVIIKKGFIIGKNKNNILTLLSLILNT